MDEKHKLDNYIYQMRNTIEDKEKLADKIDEDDKQTIKDALTETHKWLQSNNEAEKDEFEDKMKELTVICDPIIAKVYQEAGGQRQQNEDEYFEDL